MSEHIATIEWRRSTESFEYEKYNREHTLAAEKALSIPMSAAPEFHGKEEHLDPEQAFVAAIASCHMLTFLAIASKRGFVVESYSDRGVGILAKNDAKRLAITEARLSPKIVFSGKMPTLEQLQKMHESSHRQCFIANSVNCPIHVEVLEPEAR